MPEARWKGMDEFQAGIQKLQSNVSTDIIRPTNLSHAATVADKAYFSVPQVSGNAADSLQELMTNGDNAAIDSDVDYYPWLEFGGVSGKGYTNDREIVPLGRYVYPAYEELQDELLRDADDAVALAVRLAGLEVD